VVDVCLQDKRDGVSAKQLFKRLLLIHGGVPQNFVTDKLRIYVVTHRKLMSESLHDTSQYAKNRAEQSREGMSDETVL